MAAAKPDSEHDSRDLPPGPQTLREGELRRGREAPREALHGGAVFCRRLQQARGDLSPARGFRPRGQGFREGARAQPALHRGRAQPGRHLQQPRALREGERRLSERGAFHPDRHRRAGPVHPRQAGQPARRPGGHLLRSGAAGGGRSRSTARPFNLGPKFADLRTKLAVALREKGDFDAALVEFQEALKVNAKYVPAYLHLGVTYYMRGLIDRAVRVWKTALKASPNDKSVQVYLEFIKEQQKK